MSMGGGGWHVPCITSRCWTPLPMPHLCFFKAPHQKPTKQTKPPTKPHLIPTPILHSPTTTHISPRFPPFQTLLYLFWSLLLVNSFSCLKQLKRQNLYASYCIKGLDSSSTSLRLVVLLFHPKCCQVFRIWVFVCSNYSDFWNGVSDFCWFK